LRELCRICISSASQLSSRARTVKRDMECGLMRSQHQFDRILNHSLIGIALIDQNFKIERCNLLFNQIFGLETECREFKLINEPSIYIKVNGRLLSSDSINFDLSLDFHALTEMGYIDSRRDDVGHVKMIVSPISLAKDSQGFLVQAQESR
jgi:PAS domain-containing protein